MFATKLWRQIVPEGRRRPSCEGCCKHRVETTTKFVLWRAEFLQVLWSVGFFTRFSDCFAMLDLKRLGFLCLLPADQLIARCCSWRLTSTVCLFPYKLLSLPTMAWINSLFLQPLSLSLLLFFFSTFAKLNVSTQLHVLPCEGYSFYRHFHAINFDLNKECNVLWVCIVLFLSLSLWTSFFYKDGVLTLCICELLWCGQTKHMQCSRKVNAIYRYHG